MKRIFLSILFVFATVISNAQAKDSSWTIIARQENIVPNNNSVVVLSAKGTKWLVQFTARSNVAFPAMGAKASITTDTHTHIQTLIVNGKSYDIIAIHKVTK